MEDYKRLLLANKAWVQDKLSVSSDYFEKLAADQQPEFLWIGCADSRVPAEEITGTQPGQLFVHRNVANLVVHTDFNMLSVLQYAVEALKVKHIIVCGHYGCGGVFNAMTRKDLGLINKWLRHIKDVCRMHERELASIADDRERFDRVVELNVREQVMNLAETSIVQKSWRDGSGIKIHGWVYDLRTGYLKEIALMDAGSVLDTIYKYDYELE
ncbi:MAG: carbonic anhydrase [Fimbriimonadales bacterium]|jgi:carbonic anhydrase|nr:carbonic anhydrase [Fimbriimonadales bacterium]